MYTRFGTIVALVLAFSILEGAGFVRADDTPLDAPTITSVTWTAASPPSTLSTMTVKWTEADDDRIPELIFMRGACASYRYLYDGRETSWYEGCVISASGEADFPIGVVIGKGDLEAKIKLRYNNRQETHWSVSETISIGE